MTNEKIQRRAYIQRIMMKTVMKNHAAPVYDVMRKEGMEQLMITRRTESRVKQRIKYLKKLKNMDSRTNS